MEDFNIGVDWTTPISADEPSGKNTEYDTKFAELETAAIATAEQQYGDTVIAGKEPDWQQTLRLAAELSAKTHDLRVLLLMTRALTRLHGLEGMRYGIASVNTVSGNFWESLHPQLVIDEESDPQIRFSALSNFADIDGLASDIRQSVVLTSPLGVFTVKDLERLLDQGSLEINGVTITDAQLEQVVADVRRSADAPMLDVPGKIVAEIEALQKLYAEKMGSEYQPDLAPLMRPLQKIAVLLHGQDRSFQQTGSGSGEQDGDGAGTADSGHSSGSAVKGVGGINSRRDAVRQLELVSRYLEINEPTNPAPFLIRRAMKLMEMNFMDILKEMAPEGLNQASFITGIEPEQDA
ncbi:type VI secretion system protein TssA [Diaphorobacter aerolatus]|uniref:Type VI secretion system protein TssA n=1 Tax=Diaphorobacter aerolatus TaxID=1288495 RepID=A0A7H0GLD7_9BURK|nr:type VI secretion system protein TssA [Diaphorobacter aerolatus]QNP49103.1 type VI secretion system protein TssA [Diaphorobacter aerolatus]